MPHSLEGAVVPRTGDGEGDARRLDVHEHPLFEEAGAGPFVVGVAARRNRGDNLTACIQSRIRLRDVRRAEVDAVLGKDEGAAALSQPTHTLNAVATVFAQHDAAT